MREDAEYAQIIQRLEEHGEYRVLRRVQVQPTLTAVPVENTSVAAIVDVETTGLLRAEDSIIELSVRRVRFDREGKITKVDHAYSWLEAPPLPLSPDIIRLTGLTDEQLAGRTIDEEHASTLLRSADVIIAHNAAFDRPFVEARLPQTQGMPWACSCNDIDWRRLGFEGKGLGWLLAQSGWFHAGHRAQADVDATITLLRHELPDGRTSLRVLIEAASQDGWIVRAAGASFDVKERLRERGYCWDAAAAVWCREVTDAELAAEKDWLQLHDYGLDCRSRAEGPLLERVTWRTRYSSPK